MIHRSFLAALLLIAPAVSDAQTVLSTKEKLDKAKQYYEAFNIESARPLLLEIVAPNNLQEVKLEERVEAYKYLGASYAVAQQPDSAAQYFIAALRFDAFTDLNQNVFSPAELNAFATAKRLIFRVDIAAVAPKVVDPTSSKPDSGITFRLVTTHNATVEAHLVAQADTMRQVQLYNGPNDGVLPIPWRGLLQNGAPPPPGLYDLRVFGASQVRQGERTTIRQTIKIDHLHEALEDTIASLKSLPAFRGDTLVLTDSYNGSDPFLDAAKGAFIALAGGGLAFALNRDDLPGWKQHAGVISFVGVSAAIGTFSYRRTHLKIQKAQAENARRESRRVAFNNGVRANNAARVAKTVLLLTPLAR